jgi:REP element-mobilizing transposase RayT
MFFFTANVRGSRTAFSAPGVAARCLNLLQKTADELDVEVDTFCLMPDHIHLLVLTQEGVDVATFMYRFKQASGFECNQQLGWQGPFWQASYYDHVVRRDEDIESIRAYVLGNPVRAGIVEDAEKYPYAGSLIARRED